MLADREIDLEGAVVEEPGLSDPPEVENTRRPDAAERSRRPRPEAIVGRDGLFGPPDLYVTTVGEMKGLES